MTDRSRCFAYPDVSCPWLNYRSNALSGSSIISFLYSQWNFQSLDRICAIAEQCTNSQGISLHSLDKTFNYMSLESNSNCCCCCCSNYRASRLIFFSPFVPISLSIWLENPKVLCVDVFFRESYSGLILVSFESTEMAIMMRFSTTTTTWNNIDLSDKNWNLHDFIKGYL